MSEFNDILPNHLSGMPPHRDIDFYIDIETGTRPISIPLYRMAPKELREIKAQIQELLAKDFIRPTSSPLGTLVLFVIKKHGSMRICIEYHGIR